MSPFRCPTLPGPPLTSDDAPGQGRSQDLVSGGPDPLFFVSYPKSQGSPLMYLWLPPDFGGGGPGPPPPPRPPPGYALAPGISTNHACIPLSSHRLFGGSAAAMQEWESRSCRSWVGKLRIAASKSGAKRWRVKILAHPRQTFHNSFSPSSAQDRLCGMLQIGVVCIVFRSHAFAICAETPR